MIALAYIAGSLVFIGLLALGHFIVRLKLAKLFLNYMVLRHDGQLCTGKDTHCSYELTGFKTVSEWSHTALRARERSKRSPEETLEIILKCSTKDSENMARTWVQCLPIFLLEQTAHKNFKEVHKQQKRLMEIDLEDKKKKAEEDEILKKVRAELGSDITLDQFEESMETISNGGILKSNRPAKNVWDAS